MPYQPKKRKPSPLALAISVVLHAVVVLAVFVFAAREGMLGEQLKKVAVTLVHPEKAPEKPKEKETAKPPEKPAEKSAAVQPVEQTKPLPLPPVAVSRAAPVASERNAPAPATAPVLITPTPAPPSMSIPEFGADNGTGAVQTSTDSRALYKGLVESTLRSHWKRPENVADLSYVAEVNITIDPNGRIAQSEWTRNSGDTRWDDSVRQALAQTHVIDKPPPSGFPGKVLIRFDVQADTEPVK